MAAIFNVFLLNAQSFEKDADRYIGQLRIPAAAIAIAKGDSVIFFKGYGEIGSGTRQKINADAIFGIASLTKTFTALALQQAVNEGKINWEDKIKDFPNQYFNTHRWNGQTSIAHCISHTSESNPIGSNFVYNGSKYNVVFNVFETLNNADNKQDITRRFTTEIENRILFPLHMDHTIVRYDSIQSDTFKSNIVIPWNFNEDKGAFSMQDFNIESIQSGPAFGMMSSVNDLINYSHALDNNVLLNQKSLLT